MMHGEYRGCTALVRFRGGARGEEVVEDRTGSEPERILLGSGEVPRGVSEALYDMDIGEARTVVIPCERAYGRHDPDGVQRYPRSFVARGEILKVGDVLSWRHPVTGRNVPVRCIAATQDTVELDFNHPLAGKDLEYWFQLVDVVDDDGVSVRRSGVQRLRRATMKEDCDVLQTCGS